MQDWYEVAFGQIGTASLVRQTFETMRYKEYMKQARRRGDNNATANKPRLYLNGNIERIEAIEVATENSYEYLLLGDIFKYIWRYRHKEHPIQGLLKARWYLENLIQQHS